MSESEPMIVDIELDTCQNFKMNLKSIFTPFIYKNTNIKEEIHRHCIKWVYLILNALYSDQTIKGTISNFIANLISTDSEKGVRNFADKSFELLGLNHTTKEEKIHRIEHRCQQAIQSGSTNVLFSDTLIYDLFFIMYMKGGMAIRYLCLYLNTLTGSPMYDKNTLLSNLGDVTDYDFNMSINPELPKNYFLQLQTAISEAVNNVLHRIANSDDFLKNPAVIDEFERMAQTIIGSDPVLKQSRCEIESADTLGKDTFVELPTFSLSRLMAAVKTVCRGDICKRDDGRTRKNIMLLAELIDVSYPKYDMFAERVHAWKYANNSIFISFCDLENDLCTLPTTPSQSVIRFNSLDDILDDIRITIQDSIQRGDLSKVAKRKKRLVFLGDLICNYEILKNRIAGTPFDPSIHKHCQNTVKDMICKNQYINKEVGFYISNIAIGLPADAFIIYRIIRKYILELTKKLAFQKSTVMYNGQLVYMDIIEYTIQAFDRYLITTPEKTLLELRETMCRMVVDAISLELSFPDLYMKQFIAQLFLKNLIQVIAGDYTGIDSFNKTVIIERENVYNLINRPFIGDNILEILNKLIASCDEACDKTFILVEEDVACHYNIYKTLENLKCEKIVAKIFSEKSCNLLLQVFAASINPLLEKYRRFFAVHGLVFDHNIEKDDSGEYIYRLSAQYNNVFFQRDIFYIENVAFQNAPLVNKQTLLELRFDTNMPKDTDVTVFMTSESTNVQLGFTSKSSLLQQYNMLSEQSIHWYAKSNYTRRISALNGVITNAELKALQDAEFPSILTPDMPTWLQAISQSIAGVRPRWEIEGRQPDSNEILNYVNDIQTYYLIHFPAELTASIQWYTGPAYKSLNNNLRLKLPLTPEQQYNVRNLDYIFSIVQPIGYPVTLYRGIQFSLENMQEKGIIHDDGYISASSDIEKAAGFTSPTTNCCLLAISVPPTAKIISTRVYSAYSEEKEFILERNASLVIRRVDTTTFPVTVIYVDYTKII